MAKAYLTQNKRKGSVGGETYSIVKGQTIVKSKPVSVANPKTMGQMNQRSLFLDPVRFYQHSNQNYFKLAFEDKKSTESDYNAFMRNNAKLGVNITKALGDDPQWPALGNYIVSKGSLSTAVVTYLDRDNMWSISATTLSSTASTIGLLSQALKSAYTLNEGDIVTFVRVTSSLRSISSETCEPTYIDTKAPVWQIAQFKIDTASTATIDSVLSSLGAQVLAGALNIDCKDGDSAECLAVVFSRNTSTGLLVSNTSIVNNTVASDIITTMQTEAFKQKVLASWGATDGAILQGGSI